LAAGHAAIVDAVLAKPEERAEIAAVAMNLHVPFRGIWLEAPPGQLLDRVAHRSRDASDATLAVVRQQLTRETGALTAGWVSVDAGGTTAATLLKAREVLACPP
jgi:predicted kinase